MVGKGLGGRPAIFVDSFEAGGIGVVGFIVVPGGVGTRVFLRRHNVGFGEKEY